jgi:O-antigen/teichoic acid export membrane protein
MEQQTPPDLLKTLARGAGSALIVQLLSAGLNYGIQILIAQWIGVSQYGVYDFATTLGIFLAFPAALGFPSAILRFIPEYIAKQDWGRLRGIVLSSWLLTLVASLFVAIAGTFILLWLNRYRNLEDITALIIGIWAVPFIALAVLQQQMARGLQKIILAFAPYAIVYPLVLFIILLIWNISHNLNAQSLLILSAFSLFVVTTGQFLILARKFPKEINYIRPHYAINEWWKIALVLIFLDGSNMILSQTDTLMIGSILDAKAVGIYSAAYKTSLWVNFLLTSINSISAPLFAQLYVKKDMAGLQKLVSTSVRWMFFPALMLSLGLIVFAEPVLKLFGDEFIAAKWTLVALILGQLVNVGTGSVGYLLMMTGHQNQSAVVMGISALVNLILNLIGIYWLGILGAALATAFSLMLWNLWLHRLVVKYLGIYPSIIAAMR